MTQNHLFKATVLLLLLVSATACGVKNDLMTPDWQKTTAGQTDPSKPNKTIGQ